MAGHEGLRDVERAEPLVQGFLEHLSCVRRLSAHTVRAYGTDLNTYLDWCAREGTPAIDITHRRLRSYVAYLVSSGYAEKTINRRMSALRTFFAWLEREGEVGANHAAELPGRKMAKTLPATITDEDVGRLLDACEADGPEGMRDRAMIELMYATGARISEAARLVPADIDYAQGQVRLFGKGSKERIVPMYDQALRTVDTYVNQARPALAARRKAAGQPKALFVSSRGNDMNAQTLRARFERLVLLAGLGTDVTPHAMRHTFATEMLNGGADLKTVQELLGHESLATTQIYTHLSIERLKAATRQAHPRG
ncbi:MAG: tyrosine recombinase XerC [Coriobacteriales bacterium]|nr:tyrosine recombinase XerC [Coriobacteriales bacterium]